MTKRVFAGLFGAVVFAILAPIVYVLAVGVPATLTGLLAIVLGGALLGAFAGARMPGAFGFLFEVIVDA